MKFSTESNELSFFFSKSNSKKSKKWLKLKYSGKTPIGVVRRVKKREFEPTIDNHNKDFVNNWYKKTATILIRLCKRCRNILQHNYTGLTTEIQDTENELKQILEKEVYQEF